jgi:RNA polymerase sigma factor (sigma-70 family)
MDYEDLARRLQAGEEQAFLDFANRFGRELRWLFNHKGLHAFEAEDLAVTAVTDIALKVDRYQQMEQGGFRAWVLTVATRMAMDWHRARQAAFADELPEDLTDPRATTFADEIILDQDGADDDDEQPAHPIGERDQALHDGLGQLSADDRMIVEFRDLGSPLPYEEIGARLGISPGAARVRHHRALKRLEAILRNDPRLSIPATTGK